MYTPVSVPKAIAKMLYADETVIAKIRQSRLKKLFTPDSIFVTNQRIILYMPRSLGLRKTTDTKICPILRLTGESCSAPS